MNRACFIKIICATCTWGLVLFISGCGGGLLGLIAEQNPPLNETTFDNFESKLSLGLPFLLVPQTITLPENIRSMLSGYEFYSGNNKLLGISISVGLYNKNAFPQNWKPSLEGAADGSINNVAKMSGVKNFSSSKRSTTVSGRPAIITTMNYDNKNTSQVEQKGLVVVDGYVLWQISVFFSQKEDASRNVANQILQSVSIRK